MGPFSPKCTRAGDLGMHHPVNRRPPSLRARLPEDRNPPVVLGDDAPQAVVLGFVGSNGAKAGLKELQEVAHKLPSHIELWVGGTQGEDEIKEVKKTRALLIEDFEMLEQHLIRLGARF